MEIDYRDENMKRIADALEEILRLRVMFKRVHDAE